MRGARTTRRWLLWAGALLFLAIIGWARVPAAKPSGPTASAAGLYSAYLRWIAEFTTWPTEAVPPNDRPIRVCVVGDDRSGIIDSMRARIERLGLAAQGRAIALHDVLQTPEAPAEFGRRFDGCQVAFISETEALRWPTLREELRGRPILTISTIVGLAQSGSMIEFRMDERQGTVRIYVSYDEVLGAGLRISSTILNLEIVEVISNSNRRVTR